MGRAPNRSVAIDRVLSKIAAGDGDECDSELYGRARQGDADAALRLLSRIDPGGKVSDAALGYKRKARRGQ